MPIELRPPYEDLTYLSPLSEQRAERLVRFLADGLSGPVVDLGCGWAELLLQVVAAAPGASGIGVDHDPESIAHGRAEAERRGLADRVRLEVGDAAGATAAAGPAAAVICVGASQIWSEPSGSEAGMSPQPMPYAAALAALRTRVLRGGRLVYGESIWSRPPTPAATAPLGGRDDEHLGLSALVELAVDQGFQPEAVHEAGPDEWDAFESGYAACYAAWLAEHPADHPDAARVRELAARQRAGYLDGYRGVLGMAYLCLRAV